MSSTELSETELKEIEDAQYLVRKQWDLFQNTWLGEVAVKNPCDAWEYQEIIFKIKPDIIIETGSFKGGGALFLASMLDLIDHGQVFSMDVRDYNVKPIHPRITWLTMDSAQKLPLKELKQKIKGQSVLVILDSNHDAPHVLKELNAYCDIIPSGSYIIVEDTWWKGNGNGGPMDAINKWLPDHPEFEIDKTRNKFGVSNNPDGFLKRV